MFDQQGLSLDQAPPVSVVFGLFLLGSLFGLLGGISVLYYGHTIFDPGSAAAVITVHLLALGMMMSFMLGALFQMLPVIAGVVLASPIPKANLVKVLLIAGLFTLIAGFMTGISMLFLFATVLLGAPLLYIAGMMLFRLFRLSHHSASSRGMLFALLHMLLFVLLALYMTTTYAQMHDGGYFLQIKQLHYAFALFGWMALLIVSISFQTVEMFYVTPAYPALLSRYMPPGISILLAAMGTLIMTDHPSWVPAIQILLYTLFALYGIVTLRRLSQRKRPLTDATVWFWRIGMGSLIVSMLLLMLHTLMPKTLLLDTATILFISFVLSVLFAMFYKIVPFLTWFHLNAQGYFTAPMMHEVIHPKTAKKHLWIHVAVISTSLLSVLLPIAIYLAAFLMIVSFGWTGYQVLHANRLYAHTQETGEKFETDMPIS